MDSSGILQSLVRALSELPPRLLGHLGGKNGGGPTAKEDRPSRDRLSGSLPAIPRHAHRGLAADRPGRDPELLRRGQGVPRFLAESLIAMKEVGRDGEVRHPARQRPKPFDGVICPCPPVETTPT
jgi:hypothetical protein